MASHDDGYELIFHGTTGWFGSAAGDTSCVGIYVGRRVLLLDLGTGLRKVDRERLKDKHVTVLLSHLHLDHCYGLHILPMFSPASLTLLIHAELESHLETLFDAPFVKAREKMGFPIHIHTVTDTRITVGGFRVRTRSLRHNTPVIGAEVQLPGTTLAYCVDTTLCDGVLDLGRSCDKLIIETAPINGKTNGSHMTLEELRTVLRESRADEVILTHFSPLRYPDMDSRQAVLSRLGDCHPHITVAYDGRVVRG